MRKGTRPATGRLPAAPLRRLAALVVALPVLLAAEPLPEGPGDDGRWHAGPYSYSDELGGFRITGISGSGSKADPVTIRQHLESATPVTLVIRAERPILPYSVTGNGANGFIYIRFETTNASGVAWIEFEFELQETRGEASIYGDGLSFDQRRVESDNIGSSAFQRYSRDFEPYDRLLLTEGHVDPGDVAEFSFLITDFTPKREFYLVQDPRIPFS